MMILLVAGLGALLCAGIFTFVLTPVARKIGLLDFPHEVRKIHKTPTPLIGGVAIAGAVALVYAALGFIAPEILPVEIGHDKWVAIGIATIILFIVGTIDDRYNLRARYQIIGPVLAALLVVYAGITIGKVTNPFGGVFSFDAIPVISAILTFIWLMGMMYSTKLLDGLDGLSGGLTAIGAFMIWALTATEQYYQPSIGLLAFIFASACVGFLLFNFHPARVFLGDGGSLFMGFGLGILAILSGSKIATTLLVMGLPVIDVARVIMVRKLSGTPIAKGDATHLHHLLIANGVPHRAAVLLYYAAGITFGITTLFLQSRGKVVMLGILVGLGIGSAVYLQYRLRLRKKI